MSDNTIPAVEKTLLLIECLGNSATPLSRAELAGRLDVTPSTCYRILQSLMNANWVRKTSSNRYLLAGGILGAIGSLMSDTAHYGIVQPVLDRLSRETGLGSKLSIRRGDCQITVLRAESPRNLHVSGRIGAEFPVIEGSVGSALLAGEPEETLHRLASECPDEIPEKTNRTLLAERAAYLRKHGYVLNEANRWNVHAMSVPVRGETGVLAALTLLGWEDDFCPDALPVLLTKLLRSAEESAELIQP